MHFSLRKETKKGKEKESSNLCSVKETRIKGFCCESDTIKEKSRRGLGNIKMVLNLHQNTVSTVIFLQLITLFLTPKGIFSIYSFLYCI